MEMMLAENIRMYRKRKRLTQEQLAEDLGVTSGAVYKWEAKLSVPELNMIIVIADYFDTSVDALLGYTMKDNRLSVTVQHLKEYRIKKEYIGLAEAEKALKKFPHAFEVVHESAILYRVFGMERHEEKLLWRALELLDGLDEGSRKLNLDVITDKLASMACKAAVKGNQKMSFREMDSLMDQLLELENPYQCPHGRPTIISMSKHELEKKFKRIV